MPRAARSMDMEENSVASDSIPKPKSQYKHSTGHDCSICRKSNMTLSGLKIHLLTHTGEKPYLCTVCDKRFTCSSNLKKHERIHNRDYIYECEVCGKTCSDPSNMKKHMTVHSNEKAHVCPDCGKSYSYAQSLRQHMDDVHVQNGEKRLKTKRKGHFPCPECGKVFGYYWRCTLHQARIHAVDKPFKCSVCGKEFARETILNKHLQTHEKPLPCTVCDRRFSFRDQLQKHTRIHSGEKPYKCETCLRAFSQRGSLTEHLRTHTGLKPYGCPNCGQKFSSSSSLRRHERKVKSCFAVPHSDEIPMLLSPNRPIYVPTPVVHILPRVETSPVGGQSPYIPPSTSAFERSNSILAEHGISRTISSNNYDENVNFRSENGVYQTSSNDQIANNFDENGNILQENGIYKTISTNADDVDHNSNRLLENGIYPRSSAYQIANNIDQSGNFQSENRTSQIDNNLNVTGNFGQGLVPSQITMVVRCDKAGKISVIPVTLQLINGTQSTGQSLLTNGQVNTLGANLPVTMATSNHNPQHPIPTSNIGRRTFSKLKNTPLAKGKLNHHRQENDHNPTHPDTPTRVTSQPQTLILSNDPVAMETSSHHHHGYQSEPNLATDADETKAAMAPKCQSSPIPDVKPLIMIGQISTTAKNNNLPMNQQTTPNSIQSFSSKPITKPTPLPTAQNPPTISSTVVPTNNLMMAQSLTNKCAMNNCSYPLMPTTVIANPTLVIKTVLSPNHHHSTLIPINNPMIVPSPTNQYAATSNVVITNPPRVIKPVLPPNQHHSPMTNSSTAVLIINPTVIPPLANQYTTSNGNSIPTAVIRNPTQDVKPAIPQHHSMTNQQPILRTVASNVPMNGKHSKKCDVNNNMVYKKDDHIVLKHPVTNINGILPSDIQTDGTKLGIPARPNKVLLGDQPPSCMHGEITKYHMSGYHNQSPVLLDSLSGKPLSIIMERFTPLASCVKTEPKDIKPIIGVNMVAFDQ